MAWLWPSLLVVLQLSFLAIPTRCQGCSATVQRAALLSLYSSSGGPGWRNQADWNTSAPCYRTLTTRVSERASENASLPSHCCWEGVYCCLSADDDDAWLECAHRQCGCGVGNVVALALSRNRLTGELPSILSPDALQPLSCNLREIFMGGNGLGGTFPEALTALPDLRVLTLGSNALRGSLPVSLSALSLLEELDLSSNLLSGSVPAGLCGGASRFSPLRDLVLSNNNLTGLLQVTECDSLVSLDLQNNDLYGTLPDFASYHQLHILRLGNNSFSGPIPRLPFDLRLLAVLDLSDNYLTGTVPDFAANGSQLTLVRLNGNWLAGSLPADLFTLGTLGTFAAYDNLLTGTLPDNIGEARGLSGLQLQQNSLYGTIPTSLARLAYSRAHVDLSLTNMSCCGLEFVEAAGGQPAGYRYFNYSLPRLPPFLTLSLDAAKPVWDNTNQEFSNMRCPSLSLANATPEVPAYETPEWYSSHRIDLYLNWSGSDAPPVLPLLSGWSLDPEYFLYDGCYCVVGFREVWEYPTPGVPSMGPRLACVRIATPWFKAYPWAVVLIVLGGLLGAAWLTYLSCYRRGKRAAILQNYVNLRKRVKGEPLGGQVSVVVTDIEGYSDLMKQSPELMTRALNLHNALIRKARWANFGYTVEQEGDSYVLVFYEAQDAVIFCLQTQLALNRQSWPEGLFVVEQRDAPSRRRTPGPGLFNAISLMTNNLTHSLFGVRTSAQSSISLLPGHQNSEDRSLSIAPTPSSLRAAGLSVDGNRPEGIRPDSRQSSTMAGREYSAVGTPGGGGGISGGFFKSHHVLFNGMRVRMGIATGLLPPGHMSKGSAVMDMAKMVSDAANGGQIMMDEATFADIKERLEELSAVDHNGMNFKKLNAIQPPWYSCLRRKSVRNPDEALLLDMGEYTYCPGSKRLPLFSLDASTAPATPGTGGAAPVMPNTPKAAQRSKGPERIRLYQVAPPALVGRAKVFGNKLSLKDEWVCSDQPYFSAPGTLDAPLGSVDGPVLLPPITMVFAIVENGKAFAAKFRRDARRVHDVIAACIRACLRCCASRGGAGVPAAATTVPLGGPLAKLSAGGGDGGGYLCRMQDGDLKYMVAFANPQAAVEWSLLLQDVLMYADWPDAALKFWREEYDDAGRLAFRGPRMKIGVCEGNPRSIIPDHIGRADYHGASINQAARYMDAAAHGGMVALESELAVKVMAEWQAAESITLAGAGETGLAAVAETSPSGEAVGTQATGGGAPTTAAAAGSSGGGSLLGSVAQGNRRMPSVREAGEESSAHHGSVGGSNQPLTAPRAHAGGGGGGGSRAHRAPAPWDDDVPSSAASVSGVAAVELSSAAQRPSAGSSSTASTSKAGRSDPLPRLMLGHGPHSRRVAPAPALPAVPSSLAPVAASMRPVERVAGGAPGDGGEAPSPASVRPVLELWPQSMRAPALDDAPTPHTHRRRSWSEQPGSVALAAAAAAAVAAAAVEDAAAGAEEPGEGISRARSLRTHATISLRETHSSGAASAAAASPSSAAAASADTDADADRAAGPSAVGEGTEGGGLAGTDAAALRSAEEVHVALMTNLDSDRHGMSSSGKAADAGAAGVIVAGAFAAQPTGEPPHVASDPSMTSLHRSDSPHSAPSQSWAKGGGGLLPPPPHHLFHPGGGAPHGGSLPDTDASSRSSVPAASVAAATAPGQAAVSPGQRHGSNGAFRPPPLDPVSPVLSDEPLSSGEEEVGGEITVAGGTEGNSSSAPDLISTDTALSTAAVLQALGHGQLLQPLPAAPPPVPTLVPLPPPPLPRSLSPLRHVSAAGGSRHAGGMLGPTSSARASQPASSGSGASAPLILLSNAHRAFSAGAANASVAAAAAAVTGGHHRPATTPGSGGSIAAAAPSASPIGTPVHRQLSAAAAVTPVGSGPSISSVSRSPRPPALTPLALPTDRERDAALAAERAAAEEARKIQLDGPADARYRVGVLAYRIGVFRFKGSSEEIPMAYIVLEHLAGRRFPADAPKGKGGKVADASGLLQQCHTTLPDLASRLSERFFLSRPSRNQPPPLEVVASSPSNRRLRALIGGHSYHGSGGGGGNGASSPTNVAARVFSKTRSLAARATGDGYVPRDGGGGGGASAGPGSAGSLGPPSHRRTSGGLMGQLAQLASASMRWASGGGRDADSGAGAGPGSQERLRAPSGRGPTFGRSSAVSTAASDEGAGHGHGHGQGAAGGAAGRAASVASQEAATPAPSSVGTDLTAPSTPVAATASAAGEAPGLESRSVASQPGTPGSSGGGRGWSGGGGGEPTLSLPRRPAGAALLVGEGRSSPASRPSPLGASPLRHMTAAGDPLPERLSPSPSTTYGGAWCAPETAAGSDMAGLRGSTGAVAAGGDAASSGGGAEQGDECA